MPAQEVLERFVKRDPLAVMARAADFGPRDLVIADRHFCIVRFFLQVAARCGCFAIRQYGRWKGTLVGQRRRVGRIESGVVYEQALHIDTDDARSSCVASPWNSISRRATVRPKSRCCRTCHPMMPTPANWRTSLASVGRSRTPFMC